MIKYLLFVFACFLTFKVFAQNPTGKYLKDVQTGCKIWDDNYTTKDSVSWTGACKGNYAYGKGTIVWRRNGREIGRYVGVVKKGLLNGEGKYSFPEDYSLEGTFINGNLNGSGQINDNGDLMSGTFVNNILQGDGSLRFKSGLMLMGHFIDGRFVNLDQPYLNSLKRNIKFTIDKNRYANNQDSNTLYYYTLSTQAPIKGALILLPSSGESAESVICCNKQLMQLASDNHILTLVLSINNGAIDDDNTTLSFLNKSFRDVTAQFHIPKDKFILSGLSGGGMLALRYTEISRQDSSKTFIIPKALIGVDPPVDLAGLYNTAKRFITTNDGIPNLSEGRKNGLLEAKMIVKDCDESYGGPPEQHPNEYIKRSMYSRSEKNGGNAQYLIGVPLRLYCDPDILWQLKERNRDYYDMNAADLSAMINFLSLKGNTGAELIPALGKGYRLDGTRHPHSWSLIDPSDCVNWIQKLLE